MHRFDVLAFSFRLRSRLSTIAMTFAHPYPIAQIFVDGGDHTGESRDDMG